MKLAYVTPKVTAELFSANEYVAACIEATGTCAIPGSSASKIGDGTTARNNHGLCGNAGAITFTPTGATGREKDEHGYCPNRVISNLKITQEFADETAAKNGSYSAATTGNISLDALQAGHYYAATWTSTDKDHNTGTYTHYGLISVTLIDSAHPNHS